MIFLLDAKGEKAYHIKKISSCSKYLQSKISLQRYHSIFIPQFDEYKSFPVPPRPPVIVIRLSLDPFERREGRQNVLSNLEEEVKQYESFLYSVWLKQVSDTPFFPLNSM